MGATTKIGISSLLRGEGGSMSLPEEITLFCPQCGTEVADKGQCLLAIEKFLDPTKESKTGFIARLVVDCRSCQCNGKEPAIEF